MTKTARKQGASGDPRKKPDIAPRTCKDCKDTFKPRSNNTRRCDLCQAKNKHRHATRTKLPEMACSFDNEAIQDGEGNDARMKGKCLSWGLENGESGTYFWKWDDDVPYTERGPVGAILYMCELIGKPYELKQPWGEHPAGTKVRLRPVSFHFNFDAAILLKDFDFAQMEVVRKVQRKIESIVCRATHGENETCDKLTNRAALLAALQKEIASQEKTGTTPNSGDSEANVTVEDVKDQIIHAYDVEDIIAALIEGGEGDLAVWDPKSQLAVTHTPRRRFYAEIRPNGDYYGGWKWKLDVHDTGSSFVGGLEKSIDDWNPPISPKQRADIARGKQGRKVGFKDFTDDEIAAYSEAECVAHAMMCRMLLDTVLDVSNVPMKLTDLFGSGSVAKAHLDHWQVPRRGMKPTATNRSILDYEDIAQQTFFGGLIHTPLIGRVPIVDMDGNELFVIGQDINSAYPDKFVRVPCMRRTVDKKTRKIIDCGKWVETNRLPNEKHEVGHVLASWDISIPDPEGNIVDKETGERYSSPTSTPPFVVRGKNMGVYHPVKGVDTWVTLAEFREAKKEFGPKVKGHKFLYFRENCKCGNPNPLERVQRMYDERLAVKEKADAIADQCKKDGIELTQEFWSLWARQLTIKLVINSIYGKFGQMRPQPGAYTNLHIASFITGATRAQMRRKIWDIEALTGIIAYVHTDAGYALVTVKPGETLEEKRTSLDMDDQGPELGKFGAENPTRDGLLWQAGLTYFREKQKKGAWVRGGKVAARGIGTSVWEAAADGTLNQADMGEIDFTRHPKEWPAIYATDRTMYGLRKSFALGKPELAGTFQNTEKKLSVFRTDVVDGQIVIPHGQRRDYENAVQVDGIPTLWTVPPIAMVSDPATAADIKQHRSLLARRYKKAEFEDPGQGAVGDIDDGK